jgi:hypothetical protein
MAHRYRERIVTRCASGAPVTFFWHDVWYRVDEILATWRLRDRWWAAPAADAATGLGRADLSTPAERTYYRVLCRDPEGEQIFDLSYDDASGQWMLDYAHD